MNMNLRVLLLAAMLALGSLAAHATETVTVYKDAT
jgi:predicted porin